METIDIVIRIPKNTFDAASMLQEFVDDGHIINGHHMKGSTFGNMIEAIAKGIMLPNGHGDLIDRDELLKDACTAELWDGREEEVIWESTIKLAPTVIEADKNKEGSK